MTILSALICRSDLDATLALRNHLNSAKNDAGSITSQPSFAFLLLAAIKLSAIHD